MTDEQATASTQLRALARPFRFRVVQDPEGFPIIPGRLGQVESHDGHELAVFTARARLHAKLWAIPSGHQWIRSSTGASGSGHFGLRAGRTPTLSCSPWRPRARLTS